jgi:hypothetical protein
MARLIAKLLILVAVLLMPIGMAPAVASATHHAAGVAMQHCPEPAPNHGMKGGLGECTAACAAALPAADLSPQAPPRFVCEPVLPAGAEPLRGVHPDTATPPPKRS